MSELSKLFGDSLQGILIVIVPLVAAFVIRFLNAKSREAIDRIDNIFIDSLIERVTGLVAKVVATVSQTYVDGLKKDGKFDREKQKIAFNMAFESLKSLISTEYQVLLDGVFGDFNLWIGTLIEAAVRDQKPAE